MAGIDVGNVPRRIDGPSLVAAAAGLMLLPENASRLARLHRLAAFGMALQDEGSPPATPSSIRSILSRKDIGGPQIVMQDDPYSEVLIRSVSFIGGPYLVSSGSGEHTVADLEDLIDAALREDWMPKSLSVATRRLIQGLLTISDMVLKRAGLARGTAPGLSSGTPIAVPSPERLKHLSEATHISNDDLNARGAWLRNVVDGLALDAGELTNPCADDLTDDRLYITPFLRVADGYRVALPLDLGITLRFHLLRLARDEGQLRELGVRLRESSFYRFMRSLPFGSSPIELERSAVMSRYLLKIDDRRDLHLVLATDPLDDWEPAVWGTYDTGAALNRLGELVSPRVRTTYSSAEELLHLVIVDSPGRTAFWGVPDVAGSDPVLIARADDLEVVMHQEPDGLVGLLLFAEAIEKLPSGSISMNLLDEYSAYTDSEKSFYLSDDYPPNSILFQPGDGFYSRQRYQADTDRHGVVTPPPEPAIVQVRRLYPRDAPEIFIGDPHGSYIGLVVEIDGRFVFVTLHHGHAEFTGAESNLLECVAYWVRECAISTGARPTVRSTEIVVKLSEPESWRTIVESSPTSAPVKATPIETGHILEFTGSFVVLLREATNAAERALVSVLLPSLFGIERAEVALALDRVAPLGAKRMLSAFDENSAPDMLARHLPRPAMGHDQVTAQLLDELGEWLRSPSGGSLPVGGLEGPERVRALNAAVRYLFGRLELEIAAYDGRHLLEFLIAHNESLVHDARFNTIMLRSGLACFGEQSHTVAELVEHRKNSATAQRASRFLIEYVAAQPPAGTRRIVTLDYYRALALATEIIQRATTSDFLHYGLADFDVSILRSGRLGVSREEPVTNAIEAYATNSGTRSVRGAMSAESTASDEDDEFDFLDFVARSELAMRAEFGFTLDELREVCGGLLDLATADEVTRMDRALVVSTLATGRGLPAEVVSAVLDGITLTARSSFLAIGPDAFPWRFSRDMSYVRRPIVLQGNELVFGFRSIYRLGPYWVDNMLSGRLQSRAKTVEMQQCISRARGKINGAFAHSVARRLQALGMNTRTSVKKIGKRRIADPAGMDIGDVDVLAIHPGTRSIIAIEAKDFEVARTPAEIAGELEKLFLGKNGKKATVQLHAGRIAWLRQHLDDVVVEMGGDGDLSAWQVVGAIVTSEPLLTPLVSASSVLVIPFDDLELAKLHLANRRRTRPSKGSWNRGKRRRR